MSTRPARRTSPSASSPARRTPRLTPTRPRALSSATRRLTSTIRAASTRSFLLLLTPYLTRSLAPVLINAALPILLKSTKPMRSDPSTRSAFSPYAKLLSAPSTSASFAADPSLTRGRRLFQTLAGLDGEAASDCTQDWLSQAGPSHIESLVGFAKTCRISLLGAGDMQVRSHPLF